MALVTAPLRNLTVQNGTGSVVAPAVNVAPPGIPQQRVYAPPAVPKAPPIKPIDPQRTPMVPMATALKDSRPGGPASAMMLGFARAGAAQQEIDAEIAAKAAEEQKQAALREQAAALIREQYPDQEVLARGVEIGAWTPDAAMDNAAQKAAAAAEVSTQSSEDAEIEAYLRNNGRDDLADQFASGVLDVDGVAAALTPKSNGEPPRVETRYNEETGREEKVQWNPASGGWEPFGGTKAAAAADEPGFNVSQGAAALYADRMAIADSIISKPTISTVQTDRWQQGLNAVPIVGNDLTSSEFQQASQAQRDFINATLRRESGAVISSEEFANAEEQYFPRPGDTPEVLAQKAANRKVAINGIARQAGPAYKAPEIPTLTPEGVVTPPEPSSDGVDPDLPPPPDGIDPQDWQFMSPEDRALWQ